MLPCTCVLQGAVGIEHPEVYGLCQSTVACMGQLSHELQLQSLHGWVWQLQRCCWLTSALYHSVLYSEV